MANINRSYKRWLALGCSHGHLADPEALKAVLAFKERYKPHTTIHLGDYVDTAAFRSGSHGTEDEAIDLEADTNKGCRFLRDLRPDILLNGNHDYRLWKNAHHWNAIRAEAARSLIGKIRGALPKNCNFVEHYNIRQSYVVLGDTKFLHGFMYNENAIRDHAEHFGRCVFAHLHKVGQATGRRIDHSTGYCVGFLGMAELFDYALTRRSTAQWTQGFAWGEYNDQECTVNLCERLPGQQWHLPL